LDADHILGIITDGDIRRMLEKHTNLAAITAADIMGKSPKIIDKNELAANALHIMRENNITQLLVSDKGNYAGVIHIQDLLKEGII
jgi:arabinose-5-phosphate isomerase